MDAEDALRSRPGLPRGEDDAQAAEPRTSERRGFSSGGDDEAVGGMGNQRTVSLSATRS